ncbi:MAG: hypothetical protein ACJAZS_000867 [Alteromonas naphthalenivorans]|jgi:hypothetical protein
MKKSCLLFLGFSFCIIPVQAKSLDHKGLFTDLKKYKKIRGDCHAGHLYEHMVWVAKAMDTLFESKSQWLIGINKNDRRIMTIAAFMHDIGKAGDLDYNYLVKPTHPRVGFEYILGKRKYLLNKKGDTYDFDAWCNHMNVKGQDRATLAVLVGMHQEFGKALSSMKKKSTVTLSAFNTFIADLEKYTYEANYNGGMPNERIIRMSIALCRADLHGMFPVDKSIKEFPELKDHPQTLDAVPLVPGIVVDTAGYLVAQALLSHFKRRVYAYVKIDKEVKA